MPLVYYNMLHYYYNMLQYTSKYTSIHYNILEHTITYHNIPKYTAIYYSRTPTSFGAHDTPDSRRSREVPKKAIAGI